MEKQNLLKDPNTNWKYILIVIVLAFLVGGGILAYQYWWLPKQETEMPEIEIPEKEVSEEVEVPEDWKTYRNEEYGFEIKYPTELDEWGKTFGMPTSHTLRFSIPTQYFGAFDPYSFTFSAKRLTGSETENCEFRSDGSRTEDRIGGVTFARIERTEEPDVSDPYNYRNLRIEYIGKHKDICYQFIFFNYLKKKSLVDAERKELEKTITRFERIVSTFELLELQH